MAVTVELTDLDFARAQFEKLMQNNGRSVDRNSDGTYYYNKIQDYWVVFQVGFRAGRNSAGGTCEF